MATISYWKVLGKTNSRTSGAFELLSELDLFLDDDISLMHDIELEKKGRVTN